MKAFGDIKINGNLTARYATNLLTPNKTNRGDVLTTRVIAERS